MTQEQDRNTHIILLTDGAVSNTNEILELIKQNASAKKRVHTIGLGHGADQALIKGSAAAGFGNYYFIFNENEIEERVISALMNTQIPYRVFSSLEIFDENEKPISIKFEESYLN